MKIRRITGGVLIILALLTSAGFCSDAMAEDALTLKPDNGLPVLSVSIDSEEYRKVLESPDHSYKTGAASVRIDLPVGYESEFEKIDPESF